MSDQPVTGRPSRGRGREILVALGCLAVMVAAGVVIATFTTSSGTAANRPPGHPTPSDQATSGPAAMRQAAVQRVLRRRSVAILHHDRQAFAATLDPRSRAFRTSQLQMFANLRRVRFASWSYTLSVDGRHPPHARDRYPSAQATWSPSGFFLHYKIAGFDAHATDLPQYPTFVKRRGRWYLASLTDFRAGGDVSATGLWDFAPVHVVRRRGVLALGPINELGTMAAAADVLRAAIPRVSSVWGHDWARRVVLLVPSSQHEMALIDGNTGDLHQIAAITSAEVSNTFGDPQPVGDRVTLNPANWPKVGPLGARIVLTHELTHVATRADTGRQTPKWLSEGFADYVGFLNTGVSVFSAAAELRTDVRAGRLSHALPANHEFRGGNSRLPQAYEAGWLACRYLADHYGQAKLVRFYRAVGTSQLGQSQAVGRALHRVFRLSPQQFTARWHRYVTGQLA